MRFKLDKKSRAVNASKSPASFHRLRLFFNRYDVNGDGEIDYEEFVEMLNDLGLRNLHEDDMKGVFARVDVDGSGSIDIEEFAGYMTDSFTSEAVAYKGLVEKQASIITDMPATVDSHSVQFKSDKQLKHAIKWEFQDAMARQGPKIREHFVKLSAGNTRGEVDSDKPSADANLRAVAPAMLVKMLRENFAIGIGSKKGLDIILMDEAKKTADGTVSWKAMLAAFKQDEQEQGKYYMEVGKFDGPRVGKKELKEILISKLERHAVQRGARFTTPSNRHLKKLFKGIDKNNNGEVELCEFKALLLLLGIRHIHEDDAVGLFKELDVDNSGSIDYLEFCTHLLGLQWRDEKGIADLPDTVNSAKLQGKTDKQLVKLAREDISRQLQRYRVTRKQLEAYLGCSSSGAGSPRVQQVSLGKKTDGKGEVANKGEKGGEQLASVGVAAGEHSAKAGVGEDRSALTIAVAGGAVRTKRPSRTSTAVISRAQLKNCIRGKLHAAVGNERGVDLLFDEALGVDSTNGTVGDGGAITIDKFIDVFLLDEARAKHLIPTKHKFFSSQAGKEVQVKADMMTAYATLRRKSGGGGVAGAAKSAKVARGGQQFAPSRPACRKPGGSVAGRGAKAFISAETAGSLSPTQIVSFVQAAVVRLARAKSPQDPKEVVRQLGRVYRQAAKNDLGCMDAPKLQACLLRFFSLHLSEKQVAALFAQMDTAGNGELDRASFLKGFLKLSAQVSGGGSAGRVGGGAVVHFTNGKTIAGGQNRNSNQSSNGSSSHGLSSLMSPIRPRVARRSGGVGAESRGSPPDQPRTSRRVRICTPSTAGSTSEANGTPQTPEQWHGGVFETISSAPGRVQLEQFLRSKGWQSKATSNILHLTNTPSLRTPQQQQHQQQQTPRPATFRPRGAAVAIMQAMSTTAANTAACGGLKSATAWS
jgi:Ca2+-binding EF-hand superfamily protein